MSRLKIDSISTKAFGYDAETKTFYAEASDFRAYDPTFDPFRQIWDDSADVGFALKGEKTGQEVIVFEDLSQAKFDEFDDVIAWHFVPEDKYSHLFKKVVIFND